MLATFGAFFCLAASCSSSESSLPLRYTVLVNASHVRRMCRIMEWLYLLSYTRRGEYIFPKTEGDCPWYCRCGSVTGGIVFPSTVRILLRTIGFMWTVRTIGFIQ
jgi:hypothetical protein